MEKIEKKNRMQEGNRWVMVTSHTQMRKDEVERRTDEESSVNEFLTVWIRILCQ
jgi:hypothetical protein